MSETQRKALKSIRQPHQATYENIDAARIPQWVRTLLMTSPIFGFAMYFGIETSQILSILRGGDNAGVISIAAVVSSTVRGVVAIIVTSIIVIVFILIIGSKQQQAAASNKQQATASSKQQAAASNKRQQAAASSGGAA